MRKVPRQARQYRAINGDAAPLHAGQHRHEGAFQGLVDRKHALRDEPRPQQLPQPHDHIGLLGGVGGRLVDDDAVEAQLCLAGAGDLAVIDGAMVEPVLRHRVRPVRKPAGVEHIGHQHHVIVRGHIDAVMGQHLPGEFQVVPDLEHGRVLEQRLDGRERRSGINLVRHDFAGEQFRAVAAPAMGQRHVARFVRPDCEREAAQFRLHRIAAAARDADCDRARFIGPCHVGAQPLGDEHRFVARAVDLGGLRGGDALGCVSLRGERLGGRRLRGWRRIAAPSGLASRRGRGRRGAAVAAVPGRRRRCGREERRVEPRFFRAPLRMWTRNASPQPRVGLDFGGVGAAKIGNPADERVEFHGLEEGNEAFRVGIVDRDVGKRHRQRYIDIERDQPLRQPRLVGILDQAFAAFLLLDLAGAGEQGFQVAIFADELRRGLDADAGNARDVVGRIPDQRLDLDHLVGRNAEFFHDLGGTDAAVLHGVIHGDAVIDELHQVFVGRYDGGGSAGLAGLAHIGGDEIVGLVAQLLQARQVEGMDRLANQSELRDEVGWRIGPMRLVCGIEFVAECLLRLVEDDGEMGRPLLRLHVP